MQLKYPWEVQLPALSPRPGTNEQLNYLGTNSLAASKSPEFSVIRGQRSKPLGEEVA